MLFDEEIRRYLTLPRANNLLVLPQDGGSSFGEKSTPRSLHGDLLCPQRHNLHNNQPPISPPRSLNSSIATDTTATPYTPSEALRTSDAQSKAAMSLSGFDTMHDGDSDRSRFGVQGHRMNPLKSTSEGIRTVTATRLTKETENGEKIVDKEVASRRDIHKGADDAYDRDFGSAYPDRHVHIAKVDFHNTARRKSSNSSFVGEVGDPDGLDSLLQQQPWADVGRGMKTYTGADDACAQNVGSHYRQRRTRLSKVDFHNTIRRQSTNSSFNGEVGDPKGLQSLLKLQSRPGLVDRGVNGSNRKRLAVEGDIKSDAKNVRGLAAAR